MLVLGDWKGYYCRGDVEGTAEEEMRDGEYGLVTTEKGMEWVCNSVRGDKKVVIEGDQCNGLIDG